MYNNKSVYVTVTKDSLDLVSRVFPIDSECELTDDDPNDNETRVLRFEWNGDYEIEITENLDNAPDVISYQIL